MELFPVPDSFLTPEKTLKYQLKTTKSTSSFTAQAGQVIALSGSRRSYAHKTGSTSQSSIGILPSQAVEPVMHRIENYTITETSKQTTALAGTTFANAEKITYQDKKALVFVFPVGELCTLS